MLKNGNNDYLIVFTIWVMLKKVADPHTISNVVLTTLILSQQTVGEVHKFNEFICDSPLLQPYTRGGWYVMHTVKYFANGEK